MKAAELKAKLDNPGEKFQESLDANFFYLLLDVEERNESDLYERPYTIERKDITHVQYIDGFHEPHQIGETLTIDGEEYIYVDSLNLPAEMEHEADGGELVYEYRGYSFLRLLKKLS